MSLTGDVVAVNCRDSYVRSESRLVAVDGARWLRRRRDHGCRAGRPEGQRAQDVKSSLRSWLPRPARSHPGSGGVPALGKLRQPGVAYRGFQVKRLTVLPGAVLSLQLHHRRAEHWVVVSGRARITRDDEVFDLLAISTPLFRWAPGTGLRIRAPTCCEIIEVQVGDYLGEDDIVRFEDRYGRQGRTGSAERTERRRP